MTETTVETTVSSNIVAQATPYIIQIEVSSEIEPKLKEHWEKAKDSIPTKEWAGFRVGSDAFRPIWEKKVGLFAAYRPVWFELFDRAAANNKKFILDYQEVSVAQQGDKYVGNAVAYFMPEVEFPQDLNLDSIPVEVYSMHPTLIENGVKSRIDHFIEKHGQFELSEAGVVEGFEAVISVTASLDGQPWAAGTIKGGRLKILQSRLFPNELYQSLLGKKAGDKFETVCESLPKQYRGEAGRRFVAQVEVHEVYAPAVESLDTIAQRAGFKDEADMREVLKAEVEKTMQDNRKTAEDELSIHYLRSRSKIGPVPYGWLRARAKDEYQSFLSRNPGKSEKEALASVGASSAAELTGVFISQASDFLRDEAVILAFGIHHGQVDYSLDLGKNFEKVREFLKSKIVVNEVEPLSVRTGNA